MTTKREIIWKKILELDPDSKNYWNNLFHFSRMLFSPKGVKDKDQRNFYEKNIKRLDSDIKRIMSYFTQGDYTPSFSNIQYTLFNMEDYGFVKVKNEMGVSKIYKIQLINELEKIKSWILTEMGEMDLRFSSDSLNVVKM